MTFKKTKRGWYFTPVNFREIKKPQKTPQKNSDWKWLLSYRKRVFSCVVAELPAPTPTCPVVGIDKKSLASSSWDFLPTLSWAVSSLGWTVPVCSPSFHLSDALVPSSSLWLFTRLPLVSPPHLWIGEPITEHTKGNHHFLWLADNFLRSEDTFLAHGHSLAHWDPQDPSKQSYFPNHCFSATPVGCYSSLMYKTLHFPLLNITRFFSVQFSSLFRPSE